MQQEVVICVGPPGSGKSTFARALEAQAGYTRISQDNQGKKGAKRIAQKFSRPGTKAVLDRCNVTVSERAEWLSLIFGASGAKKGGGRPGPSARCTAIFLNIPAGECVARIKARKNHPTLSDDGKTSIPGVVKFFTSRIEPPTASEGFAQIHVAHSSEEANKIAREVFGVQLHPTEDDAAGDKMAAGPSPSPTPTSEAGAAHEEQRARGSKESIPELHLPRPTSKQVIDLDRILGNLAMADHDVILRRELIAKITDACAQTLPSLAVVPVGSFACGLASAGSDIDLACFQRDVACDHIDKAEPGGSEAEVLSDGRCAKASNGADTTSTSAIQVQVEDVSRVLRSIPDLCQFETVLTRSKAPDLITAIATTTGIHIDVSIRHGSGGPTAGVSKESLLRAYSRSCREFRPLVLAVKRWAKRRGLVDPIGRRLNSFTWTLMVVHYLQRIYLAPVLPVPEIEVSATHVSLISESEVKISAAQLHTLLVGFFGYWRQFSFATEAVSIRLGSTIPISQCDASADSHDVTEVDAHAPCRCFVVEDPVELDENTARTLSDRHLEEIRAELNRAYVLLCDGELFSAIESTPTRKKLEELKPYFLPPRSDVLSQTSTVVTASSKAPFGDLVERMPLPQTGKRAVLRFISAIDKQTSVLEAYLNADDRKSVHHVCEMLGLGSSRVGRQGENGGFQLKLTKPKGWSVEKVRTSSPQSWTPLETATVRELLAFPQGLAEPLESSLAELKTTTMLKSKTSLEQLIKKYRLVAKYHSSLPLVQLSYSQTESSMASPIVQECRGLILELDTWKVVSLPFFKFFNFGEGNAEDLDWSTVSVREKLDGSLMTLYFYGERWRVASSKLPEGNGKLPTTIAGTEGWTMAQLFWEIFYQKGYNLPNDTECCYMFEMTSPANLVVVRYSTRNLMCIGARNVASLKEIKCEVVAAEYGWETPTLWNFATPEAVLVAARELSPVESEGFVACDSNFHRLKFKCPAYVALHHLGGNEDRSGGAAAENDPVLRRRKLLDIARNNEGDEFLAYYPQWSVEYHGLVEGLDRVLAHLEQCSRQTPSCSELCTKLKKKGATPWAVVREAKLKVLDEAVSADKTTVSADKTTLSTKKMPHPAKTPQAKKSEDVESSRRVVEHPVKTPTVVKHGNPFAALMMGDTSDEDDEP